MGSKLNRREVFKIGGMMTAAGVLGSAVPSASASVDKIPGPDVYTRVGVQPFINLTATLTINGGTLTLPEVKEAMENASYYSVNLDELMLKVGERLAQLLGAEFAIVTAGAAAAATHAVAACIAGSDPELIQQLPDLRGFKSEVIMPRQSRNVYDHAIRAVGVKIVEVDSRQEFYAGLGLNTAMIAILGTGEARAKLRLEEISQAARKSGVPVFVDAAAELPLNPNPYLSRGADLVCYSGGKILRGPQCAGLLIGRKDLVQAAWINSSPHHAFGRMMKVGKEEILGMLAAVEVFAERGIQEDYRRWNTWLQEISDSVTRVPGVKTEMAGPGGASPYPTMEISWDSSNVELTAAEVYEFLINGRPRIMSHASGDGNSFRIRPAAMKEGEQKIVARRLHEIFSMAPRGKTRPARMAPAADVTGRWEVDVEFSAGSSRHSLFLEASGSEIRGTHLGRYLRGDLKGSLEGSRIRMASSLPVEGTRLSYRFDGIIANDRMSGTLDLGEYGHAGWMARKTAPD